MLGLCWMGNPLKWLPGWWWSHSVPPPKGEKTGRQSQTGKGKAHGRALQLKILPQPPHHDCGWNGGCHLWTGPAFCWQSPVTAKTSKASKGTVARVHSKRWLHQPGAEPRTEITLSSAVYFKILIMCSLFFQGHQTCRNIVQGLLGA